MKHITLISILAIGLFLQLAFTYAARPFNDGEALHYLRPMASDEKSDEKNEAYLCDALTTEAAKLLKKGNAGKGRSDEIYYTQAAWLLTQALAINPRHLKARCTQANLLAHRLRLDEADVVIDGVLAEAPDIVPALVIKCYILIRRQGAAIRCGDVSLQRQCLAEELRIRRHMLELEPSEPGNWERLGLATDLMDRILKKEHSALSLICSLNARNSREYFESAIAACDRQLGDRSVEGDLRSAIQAQKAYACSRLGRYKQAVDLTDILIFRRRWFVQSVFFIDVNARCNLGRSEESRKKIAAVCENGFKIWPRDEHFYRIIKSLGTGTGLATGQLGIPAQTGRYSQYSV